MDPIHSEARERVLEAAERLFGIKGYTAVTLREVATEVGIRHASLYHHVPGGKEQLFIEVTERSLKRHAIGLGNSIVNAAPTVRAQLQAAAHWLLSQPPMDLVRLSYSDMPAIDPVQAESLMRLAHDALIEPIHGVLQRAVACGEIEHPELGLVAGGILGLIESLHAVPPIALNQSREEMADKLIEVLLTGLFKDKD
jgi:TetR/AcrR family transcriptional regulator, cholesterol catabolism regulator